MKEGKTIATGEQEKIKGTVDSQQASLAQVTRLFLLYREEARKGLGDWCMQCEVSRMPLPRRWDFSRLCQSLSQRKRAGLYGRARSAEASRRRTIIGQATSDECPYPVERLVCLRRLWSLGKNV
jgi:hypothetical protein